ncbi:MAG: HlyC/CorC family transporter [Pseudomonadota bacterium]
MEFDIWITGAIIAGLILLSAFFSGSETALTAASRPRLAQLERQGHRRAATVNRLREDKGRLIGAILLGNNLVNILASALATSLFIGLLGEAAIPIVTLAMTFLILIFAEVLPKTYALDNADRMALAIVPIMRWVVAVLAPVTQAVMLIVGVLLRILGVNHQAGDVFDSEDELRGAIELHRGEDRVEDSEVAQERAMLRSILDLGDVEVSEIMVHRRNVEAIDIDLEIGEIIEAVLSSQYTRLPLWRDNPDNIVGILHAKDLLRALQEQKEPLDRSALEAILSEPWFIPDTTRLLDQLQVFRARREHFALVVDEYGALQGVVTLEDILEEIVGDISDEHDLPVAGVRGQADGTYLVRGTVTLRDLNRRFEWNLPDEEASTIAGLVLREAQRIPEVGQAFSFFGFQFEVIDRQRNQITMVRVTPASTDNEEDDARP